ncbi:MAG TPA: hypothetical protein VK249_19400 [Anaerolineales bacterium]|nr:hypothetical protein [Anaerolineales bacterium]
MDHPLTPEQKNILIEDALHTYPIAALPHELTGEVMRRVQTIPAPRPFRLTWTDFALGVILFVCALAVWFSLDHLPPLAIAQIRKESILLSHHLLVNARWLIPAISFGLGGFLAALTVPYLRRELME